MVDVRDAVRPANRVHVALQDVDDRRAALRLDHRATSRPLMCSDLSSKRSVTSSPFITRNFSSAPWSAFSPSTDVRKLWSVSTRNW